ncbi:MULTISPECIES: non-heme iron oxygenase ferredoxin subunit [unclassified Thioalkalivibrio]|uniref:Rieske (2Fe-2S) protein n=1 Tax=unclassified Thioalkalivibrio TaxID=2621013 RepID=UPI00036F22DA|nr:MULTISPECIES: non-heme iron oxygenase ferredoxin subunit [unclassified Thioalkalivibrio]
MEDWADVAAVDDIPPGERRVVEVDDVPIAVFNLEGSFYAIEDLCSHEEYPIAEGELRDDRLVCPHHGAEFCLRDGSALTAPAVEPLTCFPVRVRDGRVEVRDDRWD